MAQGAKRLVRGRSFFSSPIAERSSDCCSMGLEQGAAVELIEHCRTPGTHGLRCWVLEGLR